MYYALGVSAIFNCVLLYFLYTSKKQVKIRRHQDLSAFARDLTTYGAGILEIRRVDPDSVILRRPR